MTGPIVCCLRCTPKIICPFEQEHEQLESTCLVSLADQLMPVASADLGHNRKRTNKARRACGRFLRLIN